MAASKTPPLLAIVGGGIAGACAASLLAETCEVVLFDQGRRGPGGRASHRSEPSPLPPRADGAAQTAPASECSTLEFDHGCQFFRADTPEMKGLVEEWERHGWVAPWRGRFGSLGGSGGEAAADFFGLPADAAPVYAGVGGMHWLPRRILAEARVEVRAQTRVASVERREGGKHELYGVVGEGAYHDTPESKAAASVVSSLGVYDAVLFTDISSAFGEWHRASAGVPEEVARCVRDRVRTPLFSCMVAFDSPLASVIQLDGFNVCGKSPLWWASCSQSKPGFPAGAAECWTLISTPAFAAEEIGRELMQDPQTGAFKPQSNDYLNSVPGPQLLAAFVAAVAPVLKRAGTPMPSAIYLQAQRWGSALPAPIGVEGRDENGRSAATTVDILGVGYECALPPLVFARPTLPSVARSRDFAAVDEMKLFYAGDFCSSRSPGFEAAALSGRGAAQHIAQVMLH